MTERVKCGCGALWGDVHKQHCKGSGRESGAPLEPLRHRWADGAVWWDCPGATCPACNPSPVNPPHYRQHPSGLECIEVTEHLPFCEGNAVKYLWRHCLKNGRQDLEKAQWYLNRAILLRATRGYLDVSKPRSWEDWYTNHDRVHTAADGAINEILQGRISEAALIVSGMLTW